MSTKESTTQCPGIGAGLPNADGKHQCNVCGKWVARLGYSGSTARHVAPRSVVDAYWEQRGRQQAEYDIRLAIAKERVLILQEDDRLVVVLSLQVLSGPRHVLASFQIDSDLFDAQAQAQAFAKQVRQRLAHQEKS